MARPELISGTGNAYEYVGMGQAVDSSGMNLAEVDLGTPITPLDDASRSPGPYTDDAQGCMDACEDAYDPQDAVNPLRGLSYDPGSGGDAGTCRCYYGGGTEIAGKIDLLNYGWTWCYECFSEAPSSQPSSQLSSKPSLQPSESTACPMPTYSI